MTRNPTEARLLESVERLTSAVDRLTAALEPIGRAAALVPNRRDRIMEAVFVALVVNCGRGPEIATAIELTEELLHYFEDLRSL